MTLKYFNMNYTKLTATALVVLFVIACGNSNKESKGQVTDKKIQLQQLKDQQNKINKQVSDLEDELAKTDTSVANSINAKLVVP